MITLVFGVIFSLVVAFSAITGLSYYNEDEYSVRLIERGPEYIFQIEK